VLCLIVIGTEGWVGLQGSSPTQDAYEAGLAKQWQQIGCSAQGAPFVLTRMAQAMTKFRFLYPQPSPFAKDSPRASLLAVAFLKEDCAGARGLSGYTKAQLRDIRDRVPPNPEKPSAPAQPP